MRKYFQVSELAELSGVSVRTLHYYDEIGLLSPTRRTSSGYRLYAQTEVLRLQQILIRRELGFSLAAIGRALDDPDFDQRRALTEQRQALALRADQTARMIASIDAALATIEAGSNDTEKDMFKEIFDGFDPSEHADEARERWGNTDAYRVSMQRTGSYTEADWLRYREESDTISKELCRLMQAGEPASGAEAMAAAERHRLLIDRWFYPCSHAMHAGLADMYEADPRFAANIDKAGEGLTPYLSAAIRANAGRADAGTSTDTKG
jgi:DNA-binding transcriptional MerR regulator